MTGDPIAGTATSLVQAQFDETTHICRGLCEVVDEVRAGMTAIAAALDIELPERADGDALAAVRQRAAAVNGTKSVERILERIAADRAAGRRQSRLPAVNVHAEMPRAPWPPLPGDAEREAERFLDGQRERFSQVDHHRRLGAAKAPATPIDAHADTRKISEQMYARLRKRVG
jgi:hypothetical protein